MENTKWVLKERPIGLVKDSFVEDKVMTSYNGSEAIILRIFSIGDQNALKVASDVKDFSRTISDKLPEGISIEAFRDFTFYLKTS